MNRGGSGARSLNLELQRLLNPPGEVRVERFGWSFGPGDKVMQVANDHERQVYNGDLGIVRRVDLEEGELVVGSTAERSRMASVSWTSWAGLRDHRAQEPGLGIPGGGPPADDAALPDAEAQPRLHRGDAGQAAGGAGRPTRALAMAVRGEAGRRWSKLGEWLAGTG